MQFLHGNGICHGDFRPSNILMKVKDLNHLEMEQIIDLLGGPDADAIETYSGEDPGPSAPDYVVVPGFWDAMRESGLVTDDIAVVDFGEAYEPSDPPTFLGIPAGFAAPEVVFDGGFGLGTDIWALICTILATEDVQLFDGSIWNIASELELQIGPLPEDYRIPFQKKWHEKELSWHRLAGDPSKPEPKKITLPPRGLSRSLQPVTRTSEAIVDRREEEVKGTGYADLLTAYIGRERILYRHPTGPGVWERKQYALPRDGVLMLADLARRVFKYELSEQITASEVLNHPWLGS